MHDGGRILNVKYKRVVQKGQDVSFEPRLFPKLQSSFNTLREYVHNCNFYKNTRLVQCTIMKLLHNWASILPTYYNERFYSYINGKSVDSLW